MAKASDNPYPSILVVEGAAPATPAAGQQRLYIDSADHKLKRKDSAGTVTAIRAPGSTLQWVVGSNAGDYLTTSTAVSDIDAVNLLVTQAAAVGDVLRCKLVGFAYENDAAGYGAFGVSIAGTDYLPTSQSYPLVSSSPPIPVMAEVLHTVVSGDIVGGNVTIKARWKSTSGFHLQLQNSSGVIPTLSVERFMP